MSRDFSAHWLVRALTVIGLLGAFTIAAPAHADSVYAPEGKTTTELTLEKSTIQPGESNTAYARVTSTSGQPQGTVTFRISGGGGTATVPLVDGVATWEMPTDGLRAGKTYKVTARYNGTGASSGVDGGFQSSEDTAYLTVASGDVAGVAGAAGSQDNVAAASAGDNAGLPGVGQSASTQIAMFAGVGLVAAGMFSLALYRRRVSA